ncbi:MAG: nitrous oxide reductase accessory protein NosL [Nitrospirae bacterium]|nr:nitrous oxide reductase accessory protein NosL [Nitrospirota bacterium]
MTKITWLSLTLLLFCTFVVPSFAADLKPVNVKKDDKCPVCGMFVAKYPHWLAEVIFKDGTYAVFDGPKDMFKYYLNLQKYAPSKKSADITGVYVTEYYSTKLTDAGKLFFVTGSDVYGPMGDEFIPLASEAEAREFMRDHKGTRILRFPEVTTELLH